MKIEFDSAKDASNQAKHGVSLTLAGELDWDAALVWVDERVEYGEMRMIALAPASEVRVQDLPAEIQGGSSAAAAASGLTGDLERIEKNAILAAMNESGWNQSRAARVLGGGEGGVASWRGGFLEDARAGGGGGDGVG